MSLIKYALVAGATAVLLPWLRGVFNLSRTQPPLVIGGSVAAGFEDVKRTFRENFEKGYDSLSGGSALSVYHHGVKVVDLWGGYADSEPQRIWRENTLTMVHSCTKGVAAMCIAMLADRGLLDYDEPVARYWPEFAQKGKSRITVRQLMEHKSGLILAPPGLSRSLLRDVSKTGELLAASVPQWTVDGVTHGYQALTIGLLANELLRRVDLRHRTIGQFVAEELATPFGVDFFIGLPPEENHRVARLVMNTTPYFSRLIASLFRPEERKENWFMLTSDIFQRLAENAGDLGEFHRYNDPEYRALEIPSANGFGTADAQAKLYGILAVGGIHPATNRTLLSRQLVKSFVTDADPPSHDLVLGLPLSFSHGFIVENPMDGVTMFGHVGAGGMLAFADPEHEVGFSFVSSYMTPVIAARDQRGRRLIHSLYDCIKKLS